MRKIIKFEVGYLHTDICAKCNDPISVYTPGLEDAKPQSNWTTFGDNKDCAHYPLSDMPGTGPKD